MRNAAITVLDLGVYLNKFVLVFNRRDPFISAKSLAGLGNVILRYRDIYTQIYRDARFIRDLVAAKLCDRTLEHLRVQVEPESVEVSGLLTSENVSGSTQFEIESGKP